VHVRSRPRQIQAEIAVRHCRSRAGLRWLAMSEADTDSDHTRTAGSDIYPLLVRYAGFVAWPIAHFHPSHLPEIDSALTVLAGNEHFARPLELATYQSLDASTLDLDAETMA